MIMNGSEEMKGEFEGWIGNDNYSLERFLEEDENLY